MTDSTNRESIVRRIAALMSKTTDAGATEAEAAAAAAKAAELMEAYELDEADLSRAENRAPQFDIGAEAYFVNGSHMPKVWLCAYNIHRLCRVQVRIRDMGEAHRITIIGDRPDREMARFLFLMIDAALQREYSQYAIANKGGLSRGSKPAFQVAMAQRISTRLGRMVNEREAKPESRALVVVDAKAKAIADYMGDAKAKPAKMSLTARDARASYSGAQAGERLGLNRPISADTVRKLA